MKRFVFVIWAMTFVFVTKAQEGFFNQPTFTIGIIQHQIGIPFKEIFKKPLNLGLTIGAEFAYGNKVDPKHFQRIELGFYHHKNFNTTVFIKSDYIRRFDVGGGVFVDVQTGLGYQRSFSAFQEFKLNEEGQYQAHNRSVGSMLFDIGTSIAYEFKVGDNLVMSPYLRYEGLLQLPYSETTSILPQSLLHAGTRIKW